LQGKREAFWVFKSRLWKQDVQIENLSKFEAAEVKCVLKVQKWFRASNYPAKTRYFGYFLVLILQDTKQLDEPKQKGNV